MTASASFLLEQANIIANRAAATLMAMQGRVIEVDRKELRDVVTEADLASERIVIEGLRALTPEAAILAEEAGTLAGRNDSCWIVDPLDGTVNYAAGLPWYSVTIAYQEKGRTRLGVLHAPAAGIVAYYRDGDRATVNGCDAKMSTTRRLADAVVSVILTSHFDAEEVARAAEVIRRLGNAARGVRIIVSGGLEMVLVAMGQLDAYVSLKADIVSHAAAMPLLRATGGRITTLGGRDSEDADLEKLASNGLIHHELLDCLAGT